MTDPARRSAAGKREPWGLAEAVIGWIAFQVIGTFVAVAVLSAGDWKVFAPARPGGFVGRAVGQVEAGTELDDETIPVLLQLATLAPGWLALLGGAWAFAGALGHSRPGWRIEFSAPDVPIGVATGSLLQIPVIPVLYILVELVFGEFAPSDRALTLIDQIDTPLEVAALVLFVGIGAPVVEEIFYRGLVQRTLVDRYGAAFGIVVTGVVFGAIHFSVIEFPALAVAGIGFGAAYHVTGRLGASIMAHVTFNMITVIFLLLG